MRIGIDARMMGSAFGIGRYVQQLIKYLTELKINDSFVIFTRQISDFRFQISDLPDNFSFVKVNIKWYSFDEQTKLLGIIKKQNIDLMHFPHWNVPLLYNDPFVVTIHDLIMFHYPRPEATTLGPLKFWLKDKVHRQVIKHAVNKAKHIITTSEFTKQDVHKTLSVPVKKMTIIYQAPFVNHESGIMNYESVLEKYGIDKPFVMYVGAAYPHKNLDGLLKSWEIFEKKYDENYQLVLVGREDHFWNGHKSAIYNLQSAIHIGFVPDSELSILYQNARLYIFPSLYEGFGLPSLEAMAHGVPVVSSSRASLPEVLGEAALYFDPENYEQMADTIYMGLLDEDVRFDLKENGREELEKYSWDKLAKQTLEIYKIEN
jgi:glycosyltransferase involved in cell wall biosynthesis